ncbi:MAG: hypothetical protein HEQ38_07595 [Gemmatimonas sp.]|nr:hypothetical protein [Gemmatimonas sp.]
MEPSVLLGSTRRLVGPHVAGLDGTAQHGALDAGASLTAMYALNSRWQLAGFASARRLLRAAAASPIPRQLGD